MTRRSRRPTRATMIALATAVFLPTASDSHGALAEPDRDPDAISTVAIQVNCSVADAFALFDPRHRNRWDRDWDIEVTSGDRERDTHPGLTFQRLTDEPTAWQVTVFDPAHHTIGFKYTRPPQYHMTVKLQFAQTEAGKTTATIVYSAWGNNAAVSQALGHGLEHQIIELARGKEGWEAKINYFLEHGVRLEAFEPLAIARDHRVELDAPPEKVFALLNPDQGNHWTRGTPDYVFGAANKPGEAMWNRSDSWMLVADYDETSLTMKTVFYIPDVEFMIEEARCIARADGGTTLQVTWRVAGLSPTGNEAVQNFFDNHWDSRMQSIVRTYDGALARSHDGAP